MVWDDPGSLRIIQDPIRSYGVIWEVTKRVLRSFLELSGVGKPLISRSLRAAPGAPKMFWKQ
jgi:hypothetical protein